MRAEKSRIFVLRLQTNHPKLYLQLRERLDAGQQYRGHQNAHKKKDTEPWNVQSPVSDRVTELVEVPELD